jgi:DNA-binding NtrC family response regulator
MKKKTILVVDDDEAILPVLDVTLRAAGYRVVVTTRPTEALELIAREAVDILVSDVDMPLLDGLELVSKVKKDFPWVVRILLTAHGTVDVAMEAINRGEVFRFITKPWSRKVLTATLESASARSDELRAVADVTAAATRRAAKLDELEARYPGIATVSHEGGVRVLDSRRLEILGARLGIGTGIAS